jgi:hypothetical protein
MPICLSLSFAFQKLWVYNTSKTALLGLCKSLAMELAPKGIWVNCLVPGIINTDFSQVVRMTTGSCSHSLPLGPSGSFTGQAPVWIEEAEAPDQAHHPVSLPCSLRTGSCSFSAEEWGSLSSVERRPEFCLTALAQVGSSFHRGISQPWCFSLSDPTNSPAQHWLWNLSLGENIAILATWHEWNQWIAEVSGHLDFCGLCLLKKLHVKKRHTPDPLPVY